MFVKLDMLSQEALSDLKKVLESSVGLMAAAYPGMTFPAPDQVTDDLVANIAINAAMTILVTRARGGNINPSQLIMVCTDTTMRAQQAEARGISVKEFMVQEVGEE